MGAREVWTRSDFPLNTSTTRRGQESCERHVSIQRFKKEVSLNASKHRNRSIVVPLTTKSIIVLLFEFNMKH